MQCVIVYFIFYHSHSTFYPQELSVYLLSLFLFPSYLFIFILYLVHLVITKNQAFNILCKYVWDSCEVAAAALQSPFGFTEVLYLSISDAPYYHIYGYGSSAGEDIGFSLRKCGFSLSLVE